MVKIAANKSRQQRPSSGFRKYQRAYPDLAAFCR